HTYLLSPFILLKDSPLNEFIKLGLIIFSTILIVLLLSSQFVGRNYNRLMTWINSKVFKDNA
ncbi:MAG: hypothetical protein GX038_01000, partial [Erysipelothrix sp.]|nr:hypothetical protein [Erysipelothrix sp.]